MTDSIAIQRCMQKRTRRLRLPASIAPIRLASQPASQPEWVHGEDFAERQLALAHETRTSYFVTRACCVLRAARCLRVSCVLRAACVLRVRLSRGRRAARRGSRGRVRTYVSVAATITDHKNSVHGTSQRTQTPHQRPCETSTAS